jgi:hypothetical protein
VVEDSPLEAEEADMEEVHLVVEAADMAEEEVMVADTVVEVEVDRIAGGKSPSTAILCHYPFAKKQNPPIH